MIITFLWYPQMHTHIKRSNSKLLKALRLSNSLTHSMATSVMQMSFGQFGQPLFFGQPNLYDMTLIVAVRMEVIRTCLDEFYIYNDYTWDEIADIIISLQRDVKALNALGGIWNATQKRCIFSDISIYLGLMRRLAKLQDMPGLLWCVNEIIKSLYKP